jgi:hypothetical protein
MERRQRATRAARLLLRDMSTPMAPGHPRSLVAALVVVVVVVCKP